MEVTVAVLHDVVHLYVPSETCYLVTDGVLEAKHDAHSDDHHRQTYCHADNSNTNGRTAHLSFVAFVAVDSSGYE